MAFIANRDVIQHCNGLYFTRSGTETFVGDLESYVCLLSDVIVEKEKIILFKNYTSFVLSIVENVSRLVLLKESTNAPRSKKDHSVLPSQLLHLLPRCLYDFKRGQSERLQATSSAQEIEDVEIEYLKCRKNPLALAAPEESQFENFDLSWNSFAKRYKRLYKFVGCLSIVFNRTASFQSDISLVSHEVTFHRRMLSSLTLAGIFHSKQRDRVRRVALLKIRACI